MSVHDRLELAFTIHRNAQLQANLPERGRLLPTDDYGRCQLPKQAERVYGRPAKGDLIGHALDPQSGEVRTIVYRLPEPKQPARAGKGGKDDQSPATSDPDTVPARTRPEVTQKGLAMIGDLRTDALHQALREAAIDDRTLLALLVLALAGRNVTVQSGAGQAARDRAQIGRTLTEGGVLTTDPDAIRSAARAMLTLALSCRDNASNSGPFARIAGDAIGAALCLPNMATEAFLACLSRAAIEKAAAAAGVRVEVRAKDTRARLIERFRDGVYVYPGALFRLTPEAAAQEAQSRRTVPGSAWDDADAGGGDGDRLPDETAETGEPAGEDAGTDAGVDELADAAD